MKNVGRFEHTATHSFLFVRCTPYYSGRELCLFQIHLLMRHAFVAGANNGRDFLNVGDYNLIFICTQIATILAGVTTTPLQPSSRYYNRRTTYHSS